MRRTSRRALLAGLMALPVAPLAGCTSGDATPPDPSRATGTAADADALLRGRVTAAEDALVARYDATIAAHPALAERLAPLRDQHLAHREAVTAEGPVADGGAAAPSPSPSGGPAGGGSGGSGGPATAVPTDRAAAVAALRRAEQEAARDRTEACTAAAGAGLARLLALVAASEASHQAALGGGTA
ncbi:MAG: hypothetical protein R2737_08665 [Candidatus Nanopelagicales bacterium]